MPPTRWLHWVLAVAIVVVACWPLAAQKQPPAAAPTPVLLPELRGTVNSQVSDINDDGFIVGTMWDAADVGTGVVWVPSGSGWQIHVVGSGPHPAGPFPHAINNQEQVVLNYGTNNRASVYILGRGEVPLPIPALSPQRTESYAEAIDNNGMVLGSVHNAPDPVTGLITDYLPVVWVWDGTAWTTALLDETCNVDAGLGCDYLSISKTPGWISGDMARSAPDGGSWGRAARATLSSAGIMGTFTTLGKGMSVMPDPPAAPLSGASVVNGSGMSAGYYRACVPGNTSCNSQAAFWDANAGMTLLPTYQPFVNQIAARATGINDAGDVVGWATFAKGGSQERAAAWWKYKATSPIKLGVPKPYATAEAVAINNAKLAVGTARESSGRPHAIAWRLP